MLSSSRFSFLNEKSYRHDVARIKTVICGFQFHLSGAIATLQVSKDMNRKSSVKITTMTSVKDLA